MAVMSVVKRAGGDGGVRTAESKNTAQVVYDVQTEDSNDTQGVVLEHFRKESDLLYLYDSYKWGDTTDSALFCKTIAAQRVDSTIWTVTLTFEFPTPEDSDNKGKSNKGDPMQMPNEISISTSQDEVAVREAIYRGGFEGWVHDAAMAIGGAESDQQAFYAGGPPPGRKVMVPCNSRFRPLKPPLGKQRSYMIVTYSTSYEEFPFLVLEYLNTINLEDLDLYAYGKSLRIWKRTGLWKGMSGQIKLYHKPDEGYSIFFPYWRMTFIFHVSWYGWHEHRIDMGNLKSKNTPPPPTTFTSPGELSPEEGGVRDPIPTPRNPDAPTLPVISAEGMMEEQRERTRRHNEAIEKHRTRAGGGRI